MAFLFILGQALSAHLFGGCGQRALSRKTPIYFIWYFDFACIRFLWANTCGFVDGGTVVFLRSIPVLMLEQKAAMIGKKEQDDRAPG